MFKFRRASPSAAPEPAPPPAAPRLDPAVLESRKARARAWFEILREDICAAFETLEGEAPSWLYKGAPGRFVRSTCQPPARCSTKKIGRNARKQRKKTICETG